MDLYDCDLEVYCLRDLETESTGDMCRISDCDVLSQIANGLEYVHSQNFVHRNINPKNVLVSIKHNLCKFAISDFGFSRPSSEDRETFYRNHRSDGPLKCYSPPETMKILDLIRFEIEASPLGTRSGDVFSLGCTFFYFLTRGGHPFSEDRNAQYRVTWNNICFNRKFMARKLVEFVLQC